MTGTATVPGFAVLADEAAKRLVDALQLVPAPLERTLAHADGTWKVIFDGPGCPRAQQ